VTVAAIQLKPWYTLAEYARLTGEPLSTVKDQATRGTLHTSRRGKKRVIYLSHLMAENPDLYNSLVLVEQVRLQQRNGRLRTGLDRDQGYPW
jgi:hypothetical protein